LFWISKAQKGVFRFLLEKFISKTKRYTPLKGRRSLEKQYSLDNKDFANLGSEKRMYYPRNPPPPQAPPGKTSRTPFIIGSVGGMMSGIAAIIYLALSFGYALITVGGGGFVGMMLLIIMAVGILLAGFGYRGIKQFSGLSIGTAGFALSIVSAVFFFVTAGLGFVAFATGNYYYYYYWNGFFTIYVIFDIISLALFGVTQIIWGVAQIKWRRLTKTPGLTFATGILFIISGSFACSILLSFIGFIMYLVSSILALIVYVTLKMAN
jgi:hypothetical protein